MNEPVRVACVQAEPAILDRARTLDKLAALTAEAKAGGAQLVVFPETFVPAYPSSAWAKFLAGWADPKAKAEPADAAPRGRRPRGRDLPRARAPAPEGGRLIARLRGKAVGRGADAIVLDVGGGGYLVQPTRRATQKARGSGEVVLETYLHVREDVLQLYGFVDAEERELFEQLLSVSGVGPKVALAIVSGSTPEELRRAIALDDTARFEAIPGIGRKTAQRVVLELKEKLASGAPESTGAAPQLMAREVLVELGYSLVEAERALVEIDPELPVEERVRLVLKKAA